MDRDIIPPRDLDLVYPARMVARLRIEMLCVVAIVLVALIAFGVITWKF